MDGLIGFVSGFWKSVIGTADDDWADRTNRIYTAIMMACASLFLFKYTNMDRHINCWLYEGVQSQSDYVQDICWISNTYWEPFGEDLPNWPAMKISEPERERHEIVYYQWVSVVLLIEAAFFYLPRLIWATLSTMSGLKTSDIMDLAGKRELKQDATMANIETLARYIDQAIDRRTPLRQNSSQKLFGYVCYPCAGQSTGSWLVALYVFTKVLYFGNAVGQIFFLNAFLQVDGFYGINLLANLTTANTTHSWRETGAFPRVTMCDFLIRRLGNLHRHTVQCVLPVNMLNEKVFIFVWLWIFIVSILTGYSLVECVLRISLVGRRQVPKYLTEMGLYKPGESIDKQTSHEKAVELFQNAYLKADGIFVLLMIKNNGSFYVFSEVLRKLWMTYVQRLSTANKLRAVMANDSPNHDSKPIKFKTDHTVED